MDGFGLKPCPFCGGAPRIRSFRTWNSEHHCMGEKYYVECQRCWINGPQNWWKPEEAAEAWNRRYNDG